MNGTLGGVLSGADRYCLLEADCLELMPTFAAGSVAHCLTDPPYSEEFTHGKMRRGLNGGSPLPDGHRRMGDLGFEALTTEAMVAAAGEFARVAARWQLVFCDLESAAEWRKAFREADADYVRTGIWAKPGASPQFSGDRPAQGAEAIVIGHAPGRKRWNGGGSHAHWTHPIVPGSSTERLGHSTQKPIALMLELVSLFTDPDEIVLDPFMGSATTGVACLRLGRRFIGIERKPEYFAIARDRMEAESKGQSLRELRAGQETFGFGVGR